LTDEPGGEATMRVIVATDGSADARTAVQWARRLPLPGDARFLVVSVVPPPALPSLPDWETRERQACVHAAHEAIDDACARLGASVERQLVEGDPREAIVAAAAEWSADLVVMGARGLSAVKEFLLGSVSLGVARHAACPVLVCKGSPRGVHTVTIAHDGSPGAREALRFVAGLPLPPSTRVRVIGVAEPMRYPSTAPEIVGGALRDAVADVEHERRVALERTLAPDVAMLRDRVSVVDLSVRVGPPAPEILRYADVADSDLLVVGARGLGTMKRLLLGSVSESVLRHAACPVLVVRGRA
jgi:nucleotide-binding universal stress UspA family protein